jgi:hypothetical protein
MQEAQYKTTMQTGQWGPEYFGFIFEKIIDAQLAPDGSAWLIAYVTTLNEVQPTLEEIAWAVLPINGSSGRIYALTEFQDPRGDYFVIADYTADTAVKEIIVDFSNVDLTDFTTIQFIFDNGLITATENIRVQFNGDVGNRYTTSYYRGSAATHTVTNSVAQAYLELYALNTTTVLGGKYILTLIDYDNKAANNGGTVEGITASGITTTLVNSQLGFFRWNAVVNAQPRLNSIKLFLSGVTASFAANTRVQVVGYRTRSRYQFVKPQSDSSAMVVE